MKYSCQADVIVNGEAEAIKSDILLLPLVNQDNFVNIKLSAYCKSQTLLEFVWLLNKMRAMPTV